MKRALVLALSLLGLTTTSSHAATEVRNFGSNPGNLKMYVHVPSQLRDPAPLVLALHGCQQNAATFEADTGWSQLADKHGFYVVYPEQQRIENRSAKTGNQMGCFNWAGFYGENWDKGQGENASIKQMIDYMKQQYNIDDSKVYITGLSAGGGMTSLMLALYPEVFAGGAPMAGLPYHCATNVDQAYGCMGVTEMGFSPRPGCSDEPGEACMDPSLKRSPEQWGNLARQKNGNYSGPYPRVLIWQGDKDQYVDDDNAHEIMKQFTNLHGIGQTPTVTDLTFNGDSKHRLSEYHKDGKPVVGIVDLLGMKHGIAVDPGNGEDQGGRAGLGLFNFSHDHDVYSSYYTAKWWGLLDSNDEPVVTILEPQENARLKGVVVAKAEASDNDGIAYVEFRIDDGKPVRVTSAPYTFEFDADSLADGVHTLYVTAVDKNEEPKDKTVERRFFTGDAPSNDAPVVKITSPAAQSSIKGTISVSATAEDDDGISEVRFYYDNGSGRTQFGRATSAPYSATLDTTKLANGPLTLIVEAVDRNQAPMTGSATIQVTVDNAPAEACEDWTAFNMMHALFGRVKLANPLMWWAPTYNVVGSNEPAGAMYAITTIRTGSEPGSYALGACP